MISQTNNVLKPQTDIILTPTKAPLSSKQFRAIKTIVGRGLQTQGARDQGAASHRCLDHAEHRHGQHEWPDDHDSREGRRHDQAGLVGLPSPRPGCQGDDEAEASTTVLTAWTEF